MDTYIIEILACPDTLSPLKYTDNGLYCDKTDTVFPYFEGIPVLRRGPVSSRESRWGEETSELKLFNYRRLHDEALLPPRMLRALGNVVNRIVDEITPRFGVTLDLMCGTGLLSQALCLTPAMRSLLVVTEDSPHVLVGLKKRMSQVSARIPYALCVNPRQLPLRNSSIDQVATVAGFNNIRNSRSTLGEVARVLKPGGLLIFAHLCLLDIESEGAQIAEKQGLGDMLNLSDLDQTMRAFGLRITSADEFAHGKWPNHPDNVVPASGDLYSLMLISAVKDEHYD